jgi:hypothetical protein
MLSLNISDNKIGSGWSGSTDGTEALSNALKENNTLKELNVSSNFLEAVDAKVLADIISGNGALIKLDISNNHIRARQERHLQRICVAGGIELAR